MITRRKKNSSHLKRLLKLSYRLFDELYRYKNGSGYMCALPCVVGERDDVLP